MTSTTQRFRMMVEPYRTIESLVRDEGTKLIRVTSTSDMSGIFTGESDRRCHCCDRMLWHSREYHAAQIA